MKQMKQAALLLSVMSIPTISIAQSSARPEILVVGTYHMANPGHDLYNMRAHDVLAPERQQEMAQLMEVLKRFHPTKIAIEASVGSQRVVREYADYLAGKYTLTSNEDDQIGYRLAKELGHPKVYAVDEGGDFPVMRVINYAKANGREAEFNAVGERTKARVKAQDDYLHSHSVLETLEYMNADSSVAKDVAEYFEYVPFGEPWEYAGPDLLAVWYQRNIRIYHNIRALVESPSDRILVIYGAGHLGWLRQDIANDATVTLRKLSDFAGHR